MLWLGKRAMLIRNQALCYFVLDCSELILLSQVLPGRAMTGFVGKIILNAVRQFSFLALERMLLETQYDALPNIESAGHT